jgi:hypothetical protein
MSGREFRDWAHKGITLIGMSGVGKTMLSSKLPRNKWFHFSGDYRIGTRYLSEAINDGLKKQAMQVPGLAELLRTNSIYIHHNITVDNLAPMSYFMGMIGDPARGGFTVEEFKRRQALHLQAEINAMYDVPEFIHKAEDIYGYAHFLNDSGGSLCEVGDEALFEQLGRDTLFVYLRAPEEMQADLVTRAQSHPKPLYYQPDFLDASLAEFLDERGLRAVEDINPPEFARWVFPRLVAHRLPRYQRLADLYGITIDARVAAEVKNEAALIDLICDTLDAAPARAPE